MTRAGRGRACLLLNRINIAYWKNKRGSDPRLTKSALVFLFEFYFTHTHTHTHTRRGSFSGSRYRGVITCGKGSARARSWHNNYLVCVPLFDSADLPPAVPLPSSDSLGSRRTQSAGQRVAHPGATARLQGVPPPWCGARPGVCPLGAPSRDHARRHEKAKTSKLTHQARRRMIRQVRLANQRLQHVNGGLQYVNVAATQFERDRVHHHLFSSFASS